MGVAATLPELSEWTLLPVLEAELRDSGSISIDNNLRPIKNVTILMKGSYHEND